MTVISSFTKQTPGTVLTYDLAGNELARSNATSVLKLGWNGADQCTAITNGVLVTLIQYDGLGHWVRITDYNGASLVDDRRFVWSGNTLMEERDATGTNVVKRFYANGFQQNGTNFYYLKDNLGSVREVTDANGNIVARFSYDPYGNRTQTLGTLQVDYGFAGLFNIAGLDAAVYRFYDPTTARWVNRDPIGETGGWNLYAYCDNAPTTAIDPLGHNRTIWWGGGHFWIEVDTYDPSGHKTGTVDLTFTLAQAPWTAGLSPDYQVITNPPTKGNLLQYMDNGPRNHGRFLPVWWNKTSTCVEDNGLVARWKQAVTDPRYPRYNLIPYNCLTMSLLQFFETAPISQAPTIETTYSGGLQNLPPLLLSPPK